MGTNPYFSDTYRSEQNLYEDITIEALSIYGQLIYYLPRELVSEDKIFGDDIPSRFSSSFKLSMYIENLDGFDGEGDLFSRFGVEIRDEATFVVARRTFTRFVDQLTAEALIRPREGDLIYLTTANKLFQIMHVEHEQPFYQLNNLPLYKMRCQLFEYNDEDLDTGIEEIDEVEADYAYKYVLTLDSDITNVSQGDSVSQILSNGVVVSGEIIKYNPDTNQLEVAHVGATDGGFHTFLDSASVTISGNYRPDSDRIVLSVTEENDISETEQNDIFIDETQFIDFSENNPFGEPES